MVVASWLFGILGETTDAEYTLENCLNKKAKLHVLTNAVARSCF